LVKRYWHGKAKADGEKTVPVPLCPIHISPAMAWK
jgi:hypothetical protein